MTTPRPVSIPQHAVTVDVGAGAETAVTLSWSVDRDLTGSGLPGQVRAVTGASVGSGEISLEDAAVRTPWRASRFLPGGTVAIDADGDTGTAFQFSPKPVARMVVTDVAAPTALSAERSLTITDDVRAMRGELTIPPTLLIGTSGPVDAVSVDASWLIYLAAKAGGRHAVPPPVASAILAAPLCGNFDAEVGTAAPVANSNLFWETDPRGRIFAYQASGDYMFTEPWAVGETVYVTCTSRAPGNGLLQLHPEGAETTYVMVAPASTFTCKVVVEGVETSGSGAWSLPFDKPEYPERYQFKIERLSATQTRFSGRDRPTAPFAGTVTLTHASLPAPITRLGWFMNLAGAQITRADDPALWTPPTATIAASGSTLDAVVGVGSRGAWDLAQEVAAATMGAVWIDELGNLVYRPRDVMRGAGVSQGMITADGVTDLPWSLSMDDVADRVEVSYRPANLTLAEDYSVTIWEADEPIKVGPGRTVQKVVDLDNAVASLLAPFFPIWSDNSGLAPAGTYSRWAAATSANGGGTRPKDSALRVTAVQTSASRVVLTIRNTTSSTLWTVDSSGSPTLILRGNALARPGEPVTIAAGAEATAARNPLTVDLGPWVQDADFAAEALSWLQAMTSAPMAMLEQVEATQVDMGIRLGDVRKLVDPTFTGIGAKVLVAGTSLSAEAGDLSQRLRLVVLAPMFNDLDRALVALGVTTFDQLDTFLGSKGLTTFDDLDTWLLTIGGL